MKCHSLEIIQNDLIGGPNSAEFSLGDIKVTINQNVIRQIVIEHKSICEHDLLYKVFINLEKLCVLCEGRFYDISKINFYDENNNCINDDSLEQNILSRRLKYTETLDILQNRYSSLVNIFEMISNKAYTKWLDMLKNADLIHQIFLYFTSSIGVPVDGKVAFLIELCEPLIDLVSLYTNKFSSMNTGKDYASLKTCIDVLISNYGLEIFEVEYKTNAEKFLQILVNSRVRIMHIKRDFSKLFLSGQESLLYIFKFSILYRHIFLSLLDVDYELYKQKLHENINAINCWNGVLNNFINEKLK